MTQPTPRLILRTAAILGATAVIFGAFAAHALRVRLAPEQLGWWQTGVHYQLAHALALLVIPALPLRRPAIPAALFTAGTIIFSGTLYAMALGLPRWLGAITPVGGLLLIAGWIALAILATAPFASDR